MSSKIFYLERKKQQTVSKLMLIALVDAYARQHHGIPFGPVDIKAGSVTALISRGLIVNVPCYEAEVMQANWQVTDEAINILKSMGVSAN